MDHDNVAYERLPEEDAPAVAEDGQGHGAGRGSLQALMSVMLASWTYLVGEGCGPQQSALTCCCEAAWSYSCMVALANHLMLHGCAMYE